MAFGDWLQGLFTPSGQPTYSNLQPYVPTNVLNYDPSQIAPTQGLMLGGIGGLSQYNLGGMNLGQAQNIGQNMLGNWGAPGALGGAMTAAGLGQSAAANQFGAGGAIYGSAFDPQQALYNRSLQNVTEGARANAMAAGLGTSPLGIGATDWAQNMFNIDWQNQQLMRQIQGSQAASGLQAGAPGLAMTSAMYPWQTAQGIGGANLGTLANLGTYGINAAQLPGQQIAGWQNALGTMGALQAQAFGQQQGVFQDQMGIMNAQNAQAQQNYQNMVQGLSGIGNMLGAAAGFGGGMLGGGGGFGGFGGGFGSLGSTAYPQGYGWGGTSNPWIALGQGARNFFGGGAGGPQYSTAVGG